ncbi:MAG: 50S ribosomal protein L21 [Dehalococcoidia bacterium]
MATYAIIETGGKQYRVAPGDILDVERLTDHEPGDTIEIEKVLLVNQDDDVTVGAPYVDGARVVAKVESEGRAKKIIVFKYKPKTRYRRKKGHRQQYSRISIEDIAVGAPVERSRRRKTKAEAEAAEEA